MFGRGIGAISKCSLSEHGSPAVGDRDSVIRVWIDAGPDLKEFKRGLRVGDVGLAYSITRALRVLEERDKGDRTEYRENGDDDDKFNEREGATVSVVHERK